MKELVIGTVVASFSKEQGFVEESTQDDTSEELLEYVRIVGRHIGLKNAAIVFGYRYKKGILELQADLGEIEASYAEDEIQDVLKYYRLNVDAFWYFLLWLSDLVLCKFEKSYKCPESPIKTLKRIKAFMEDSTEEESLKSSLNMKLDKDEFSVSNKMVFKHLSKAIDYYIANYCQKLDKESPEHKELYNAAYKQKDGSYKSIEQAFEEYEQDSTQMKFDPENLETEKKYKLFYFYLLVEWLIKGNNREVDKEYFKKVKRQKEVNMELFVSRLLYALGIIDDDKYWRRVDNYSEKNVPKIKFHNIIKECKLEELNSIKGINVIYD